MTDNLITEFTNLLYTNKLTVADRFQLLTMFRDLQNEAKKAQNAANRNADLHDIALEDVRYLQEERHELMKLSKSLYHRNRELIAENHELTITKLGITI